MSGDPYPKGKQLARGEKRYRRKIASPKQWQAIIQSKQGPCRVCPPVAGNGHVPPLLHFHHLIPRARGGDDVPDNIVPLCPDCHDEITRLEDTAIRTLALSLTDGERAYVARKVKR